MAMSSADPPPAAGPSQGSARHESVRPRSARDVPRGAEREPLAERAPVALGVVNDGHPADPQTPLAPHQASCAARQAKPDELAIARRDFERGASDSPQNNTGIRREAQPQADDAEAVLGGG